MTNLFEQLTLPHLNALFQTALRVTNDRKTAELVVRDVYEAAWRTFQRKRILNGRLDLFKLLFACVRQRSREWFSFRWQMETDACPGESGEESLTTLDYLREADIISALEKVPMPFREVILLVDCQEFSYSEAADILNLSPDTIPDRLRNGRRYLHTVLGPTAQTAKVAQ